MGTEFYEEGMALVTNERLEPLLASASLRGRCMALNIAICNAKPELQNFPLPKPVSADDFLICADWFEERGSPEIAMQCRNAVLILRHDKKLRETFQRAPWSLECPACGLDQVLPVVAGFPSSEGLEMGTLGFFAFGGCGFLDHDWSCDACRHQWAHRGEEDVKLREALFDYFDLAFEPKPPLIPRETLAKQEVQEFINTVVPQAIKDGASAIHLEDHALFFVIRGQRIVVSPFHFSWRAEPLRNRIAELMMQRGSLHFFSAALNEREYQVEANVEQNTENPGIEIRLRGNDFPLEVLGEIPARNRLPPCTYCGYALATSLAKQCLHCGMDWHDARHPVRR